MARSAPARKNAKNGGGGAPGSAAKKAKRAQGKGAPRPASSRSTRGAKKATRGGRTTSAARKVASRRTKAPASRAATSVEAALLVEDVSRQLPPLTEEERIESAKYDAGRPRRAFEAERFVFPETYGLNRVRLLVKDPDWLFAHWDVKESSLAELRNELGSRAVDLSRLTLRVVDPGNGGMSVVLLPPGARSWYVRADTTRRSYRAELGLTLPSGEFRRLAESNTVVTPRVGPSRERARRVVVYRQGSVLPRDAVRAAVEEEARSSSAGRWNPVPDRVAPQSPEESSASSELRGGTSETFLGGASDVHRR